MTESIPDMLAKSRKKEYPRCKNDRPPEICRFTCNCTETDKGLKHVKHGYSVNSDVADACNSLRESQS